MHRDLYFAYGSNMTSARLRARIPSARSVGAARIDGRRLVCNKRGRDGSGKANLCASPGSEAWGVVYEVDAADWPELDRNEPGYERVSAEVVTAGGERLSVQVYLATSLTDDPVPYDWYRELVVAGAREHGLPAAYVREISELPSRRDPTSAQ